MEALIQAIAEKNLFVDPLKTSKQGAIKIAILSEVIGPLINRSTSPDEVLSYQLSETREVAEIPSRKFKSREKLRGLKQARVYGAVDESLRYNVISKSEHLGNINSITFGDSVTESNDAVGLPARAIYDWGYSIQDVKDVTDTLQHNALSEAGTMFNEETGKLRQSLFQVQYIKQGTLIPRFITLENATPEMLVHLLTTVIFENRYGAQSTTTGANMRNHIIGIGYGNFEAPFNSYLMAKEWDYENKPTPTLEEVKEAMDTRMRNFYGSDYLNGDEVTSQIQALWHSENEKALEELYADFTKKATQYLKDIKVIKK